MARKLQVANPAQVLDRHGKVLVEMLRWPNGAPSSLATPGWIMARLEGLGFTRRREVTDRIGKGGRYFLTAAGERVALRLRDGMGERS